MGKIYLKQLQLTILRRKLTFVCHSRNLLRTLWPFCLMVHYKDFWTDFQPVAHNIENSSDTDRLLSTCQCSNRAALICQFDRDPDDSRGGGSFSILACRSHKSVTQLSPIDQPPNTWILYLYYHYRGKKVTFLID